MALATSLATPVSDVSVKMKSTSLVSRSPSLLLRSRAYRLPTSAKRVRAIAAKQRFGKGADGHRWKQGELRWEHSSE
jgi:hypothetical protein